MQCAPDSLNACGQAPYLLILTVAVAELVLTGAAAARQP